MESAPAPDGTGWHIKAPFRCRCTFHDAARDCLYPGLLLSYPRSHVASYLYVAKARVASPRTPGPAPLVAIYM